jgi:hypothetical protein
VSTARTIPVTNETTPPREMMLDILSTDIGPYVAKFATGEKYAKTDWSKVEAYTQGSMGIGTVIKRLSTLQFDRCVFTNFDTDHIFSATLNRACLQNRLLDQMHTYDATLRAVEAANLTMLSLAENQSTNMARIAIVCNTAHSDLKYDNIISLYTDLLEKAADPLDGFEQYNVVDWDGYDAEPITPETLAYARQLMKVMPTTLGKPDAAPAGDGSIALEWVPEHHEKLDRLFLDIGPNEVWRAYWTLHNGEFHRVTHEGFSDDTKLVLQDIFIQITV